MWVRRSVDIDNGYWDREIDISAQTGVHQYTYPRVFELTGEAGSPIYLFYRAKDNGTTGEGMHFSKSTDGGVTWSADTAVITNGTAKPYHILAQNGTARLDLIVNDDNPNSAATNNLYHGYVQAGNLYKSDGTLVGALSAGPYAPSALTLVNSGSSNGRCWGWDLSVDASGYPVIAYTKLPSTTDHRYRYARWTGAAWVDNEICAGGGSICPGVGEDYYSGGIAIDRIDPNIVYLSKQVNDIHEMYKYTTADNGATWSSVAITSNSTTGNYRPVTPSGALASSPMFYMSGTYTAYTNFATQIKAYAP
jgi:hypothetical protein